MVLPIFHIRRSGGIETADSHGPGRTLTIILASVIPTSVLILVALAAFCVFRRRRRGFLKRGITPIDDEEIESWKNEKLDEKTIEGSESAQESQSSPHQKHQPKKSSVSTIQKPPSVILYQRDPNYPRPSFDRASTMRGPSVDLPAPVTALAPNARPGLTDETIQGDDAFIPKVKRQPSRLAKTQPPSSFRRHQNSRSSTSQSSIPVTSDDWYGYDPSMIQTLGRYSSDQAPPTPPMNAYYGRDRAHSGSHHSSYDDDEQLAGLSPRPRLHKSEIGRAIG